MAALRSPVAYIAAALAVIALAVVLIGVLSLGGGPRGDGRASATFVGAASCRTCHEAEFNAWHGSHHEMAMLKPDERSVKGDFDDSSFTQHGITHRFYRKGDDYYVHTEGPDGEMEDYRVAYTFGVEPLQQYLIAFEGGRYQCLPIAWGTEEDRWFHIYGDERIPPDDELFWTDRLQNWNYMCASCHSTDLHRNYDPEEHAYHTVYAELNVSCEACHGPGSVHVEWAEAGWLERLQMDRDITESKGLTVDLNESPQITEMNSCAPCHTRRQEIHPDYTHGDHFYDHFMPELLEEGLFFADGQIYDEVFEVASFLQSRMYYEGVRCSDCHEPHSLELRASGNQLCIRCHEPEQYDTPAHHFHAPGTIGAQCIECHMPERTYMQVDDRRDHGFRVPRPDLTAKLGADVVPNTCNACHTDRSADWAADMVETWHGPDRLHRGFHFAEALHAGRERDPHAPDLLKRVLNNPAEPAIVRATAVQLLGRLEDHSDEQIELIAAGLDDREPIVRAAAAAAMQHVEPRRRAELLAPALEDDRRAVRTEAARVLADGPAELLPPGQAEVFNRALAEYKRGQKALLDQPGACLNLAVVYEHEGRLDKAEWAYRHALRVDAGFYPARMNLAMLYHQQGRHDRAEQLLRQVIELNDEFGEAFYSLGLLLAEQNQLVEAAGHLKQAAELMPDRARVHYNAALAHQQLDQPAIAERLYLQAVQLEPDSPDILNAVAIFYIQQGHYDRARRFALRLAQLYPQAPQPQQLLQEIRRRAAAEDLHDRE